MTLNGSDPSTIPQLMTLNAAAADLGCSKEHLRRAIRAGRLACYKFGRNTRIAPEHLAAYLARHLCPAHDQQRQTLVAETGNGVTESAVEVFRHAQRVNRALDRSSQASNRKASSARNLG